jgi:FkbM family methyltransferase
LKKGKITPTMQNPVTFLIKSWLLRTILRATPIFRGHTIALTWLFRLLPVSKQAAMQIGKSRFPMDLSYSTHLSCVRLGHYEPLESEALEKTLCPGDNFLDIGANWGYFSALASHFVGNSGTVYGIEPNPETFRRFKLMLQRSGAINVLPFNFALGSHDLGRARFLSPLFASDAFGRIDNFSKFGHVHEVLLISLDSWWKRVGRPVFRMAKIDVEGMEPKVIVGGVECLTYGVTESILVEINEWTRSRCGEPYESCYRALRKCGFSHIYEPSETGYQEVLVGDQIHQTPFPVHKTMLFSKRPLGSPAAPAATHPV